MINLEYGIYLIEATGTGFYKIGFANNVSRRLDELRSKFWPIKLRLVHTTKCSFSYPGTMENRYHQWFLHKQIAWADEKLRSEREWFVLKSCDVELFKVCDEGNYRQLMTGVEHIVVNGADPFGGKSVEWLSLRFENFPAELDQ